MAVSLLDFQNGEVIPSIHCYTMKSLREIIEHYSENKQYMKILKYLFYMYCPDPEINPCFHFEQIEKNEFIAHEIEIDFSLEDDLVVAADKCVKACYETELSRAFYGIKTFIDNMSMAMRDTKPTFGRDGSAAGLLQLAKNFDDVRQSYKGVYKDLMEEQKTTVRGDQNLAYDG